MGRTDRLGQSTPSDAGAQYRLMAETVRQVPEKYSTAQHVFHPRLTSYGRRIWAAVPPLLLVAVALLALFSRRPRGPVIAVLILLALAGGIIAYGYLRPALSVITRTHFLKSRWIGFQAVPRDRVHQVVTVDKLLPPRAKAGKSRGRPYLWLVTETGKRAMALDGLVWDKATLKSFGDLCQAQHVNFKEATPQQIGQHWPKLVEWHVRYPRLRYAASSLALVLVIALTVWLTVVQAAQ